MPSRYLTLMHDNYPDNIRRYDHDPRSPFYRDPVGDAVRDAEDEYEADHAEMLGALKRLGVAHEVRSDCDPDENGPNVSVMLLLACEAEGPEATRLANATGGESALATALRGVEPGDVVGVSAALAAAHDAAD